jgi:hypothetical protein
MIPRTSSGGIDFGLSSHPYVPLVRWLRRHGLCPCGDRQGEHYSEMPHHSFLLAMAAIANNDGSGDQFNRPAPAHTFAESTHFSELCA